MGIYATQGASRSDIINEILTEARQHSRIIDHRTKPSCLWTVEEYTSPNNPTTPKGTKMIVCYLLVKPSKRDPYASWGYKPMDEGMGPCQYDCPLYLLDQAPLDPSDPANKYALEWREKVHEYAARQRQAKELTVGTTITLLNCSKVPQVRIISTGKSLKGQDPITGRIYRIPKSMVGEVVQDAN